MQQKAAEELVGAQRHDLDFVAVCVVPPAKADLRAVKARQAVVGDGDAMGVTPQISEHLGGAGKQRTGILPIVTAT